MKTLKIELAHCSYPIHVGADLIDRGDLLAPYVKRREVMLVSNDVVAPLYQERLVKALPADRVRSFVLPDGEQHKTLGSLDRIVAALLEAKLARDCVIVALGGGVTGDVAGFAAAAYQRGVDYVQVPTTLLSQVDSSVGGKTAVNHALGKNMIGAFHQPVCVVSDTSTLATLPDRELRAGISEVVKYGIVFDREFFSWLESHIDDLLAGDEHALTEAVVRSCEIKARIVRADERETGIRALLNLGHTFGHAIETALGYGRWLHGEAVAAGMCLAADLSARLGRMEVADVTRIESLLTRAQLPTRAPAGVEPDELLELMSVDKKVLAGRLRLVLLDGIGAGVVTGDFDASALRTTLERCREAA